jgi:hypothetical protein
MIAGVLEGEGNVSSNGASAKVPAGAEIVIPFVGSTVGNYEQTDIQPYDDESFDALPLENLERQITPAPPWNGILEGNWIVDWDISIFNCSDGDRVEFESNNVAVISTENGTISFDTWFMDKAVYTSNNQFEAFGIYPSVSLDSGEISGTFSSQVEFRTTSTNEVQGTLNQTYIDYDDGNSCSITNTFTMTYVGGSN